MRSLDDLLKEAKEGKLTDEELAYVVQKIKAYQPDSDEDLYTLLYTLGRSNATQYRKLVEGFLYYPTDPMISSIALRTLCGYWGLSENYVEELKKFIKGVDWDDGDIRIVAIGAAGELLRSRPQTELLQLLIEIFESEVKGERDLLFQECAYEALARAVGQEWAEILAEETLPNPLIIKKAHQMLQTQQKGERT